MHSCSPGDGPARERENGNLHSSARIVHMLLLSCWEELRFYSLVPCGPNSLTLRFPYSRRRITSRRHGFMSSHTERAVTETTGHMS